MLGLILNQSGLTGLSIIGEREISGRRDSAQGSPFAKSLPLTPDRCQILPAVPLLGAVARPKRLLADKAYESPPRAATASSTAAALEALGTLGMAWHRPGTVCRRLSAHPDALYLTPFWHRYPPASKWARCQIGAKENDQWRF